MWLGEGAKGWNLANLILAKQTLPVPTYVEAAKRLAVTRSPMDAGRVLQTIFSLGPHNAQDQKRQATVASPGMLAPAFCILMLESNNNPEITHAKIIAEVHFHAQALGLNT